MSKGMQRQAALITALSIGPGLPAARRGVRRARPRDAPPFKARDRGRGGRPADDGADRLAQPARARGFLRYGRPSAPRRCAARKEIDELKLGLHRVQVVFREPMTDEALHGLFNVVSVSRTGSLCTMVVRGDRARIAKKIASLEPQFCEFLSLSLEEVFIRKWRRSAMTSKKSYAKSPLFAVFSHAALQPAHAADPVRRRAGAGAAGCGVISLNPSDVTYSYDYGGINHYIAAQRQLMTVCGLIPLLCFALALAVGEFGYLNQRRKLDFYHAIPVRRSDMFFGARTAGVGIFGARRFARRTRADSDRERPICDDFGGRRPTRAGLCCDLEERRVHGVFGACGVFLRGTRRRRSKKSVGGGVLPPAAFGGVSALGDDHHPDCPKFHDVLPLVG